MGCGEGGRPIHSDPSSPPSTMGEMAGGHSFRCNSWHSCLNGRATISFKTPLFESNVRTFLIKCMITIRSYDDHVPCHLVTFTRASPVMTQASHYSWQIHAFAILARAKAHIMRTNRAPPLLSSPAAHSAHPLHTRLDGPRARTKQH